MVRLNLGKIFFLGRKGKWKNAGRGLDLYSMGLGLV